MIWEFGGTTIFGNTHIVILSNGNQSFHGDAMIPTSTDTHFGRVTAQPNDALGRAVRVERIPRWHKGTRWARFSVVNGVITLINGHINV